MNDEDRDELQIFYSLFPMPPLNSSVAHDDNTDYCPLQLGIRYFEHVCFYFTYAYGYAAFVPRTSVFVYLMTVLIAYAYDVDVVT